MKTTYFIDTTNGPVIKTRYEFNFKPLLKVVLSIVLTLVVLLVSLVWLDSSLPKVKASYSSGGILVFQDMNDHYLAYVKYANAEQLEQIKSLNIILDDTVEDFALCTTEGKYFEINLENEKVCVHRDNASIPSNYNTYLPPEEEAQMLEVSSEETQYLYKELSRIFKI